MKSNIPAYFKNGFWTLCLSIGLIYFSPMRASATTGEELLVASLKSGDLNRGTLDCPILADAVAAATVAHKAEAPGIVAAAIRKSHGCDCSKMLVAVSTKSVGKYIEMDKKLIPSIVRSAILASAFSSENNKYGATGCECASGIASAAVTALGDNVTSELIADITRYAILAAGGTCADGIVEAMTNAAPLYAATIADTAAQATDGAYKPKVSIVTFNQNGQNDLPGNSDRPLPAPFVITPSAVGGIAPGEVTPVN